MTAIWTRTAAAAKQAENSEQRHGPWSAGVAAVLLLLLVGGGPVAWAQHSAGGRGNAPAGRGAFALQVNASPDASLIAAQHDSLRRRGEPAYRTQTARGGVTYHRLRVGPFPSRAAAQAFAGCRPDSAATWLVPATADRAAFQQVVREVSTDVVSLRPRRPRFLLGREHAFAALLLPAEGRATATSQPATLRLYAPGRAAPATVERVTGLRETRAGVEYGHAARVFLKDRDEAVADHAEEVEAFSRAHGLSQYLVEDGLALYGGGRVARFTLLGSLALPSGMPETHSQPGFDYVGGNGQTVRHQNRMGPGQASQVGHADAERLRADAPTHAATRRAALFARSTARGGNARVCVLFFEGERAGGAQRHTTDQIDRAGDAEHRRR